MAVTLWQQFEYYYNQKFLSRPMTLQLSSFSSPPFPFFWLSSFPPSLPFSPLPLPLPPFLPSFLPHSLPPSLLLPSLPPSPPLPPFFLPPSLPPRFSVDAEVCVGIDAQRRRLNARLHSAGHLLDSAFSVLGMTHLEPHKASTQLTA